MSPRNAFTNDQKRTICLYKQNNPLIKDKEIGNHFSKILTLKKYQNHLYSYFNLLNKVIFGFNEL